MTEPRTPQGAATKIMAATEQLLLDVSLHELSVSDIIKAAGISRPTFYYHFTSKYDVIGALVRRITDEIAVGVQPFIDAAPELGGRPAPEIYEEALRESLYGAAQVWREHRAVLQAVSELWHSVPELETLWRGLTEPFIDAVAEAIDDLRERGIVPQGTSSRRIASTLAWATERCLYVAGRGVDDELPNERLIVEPLMGLWLGGVFGSAWVRGERGVERA